MRKTILGFKQDKLVELGLSMDETLILKHIEDFINSGKTETIYDEKDKTLYHWIYYEKLLQDLPILDITPESISRIIRCNLGEEPAGYKEKLATLTENGKRKAKSRKYLGLVKNKTVKNNIYGSRSYLAFTSKFYDLKEDLFDEYDRGTSPYLDRGTSPSAETTKSPCLDRGTSPCLDGGTSPEQRYIYKYIYIVDYLNKKTGKNFKSDSSRTRKLIDARFNEGYTIEDFRKVIDTKVAQWKGDKKMDGYLRPETLFSNKFEGYLNEKIIEDSKEDKKKASNGMTGYQDM